MSNTIQVIDNQQLLSIGFEDILKYHGGLLPGGVAHAFQAMRAGFAALSSEPLQRRRILVRTAFNGPGGRDAVEYVTRAYTGERVIYDRELGTPNVLDALPGPYVWHFTYGALTARAQITAGWVRPEFIELGQKPNKTAADLERQVYLRQEMADRLLAAAPQEVYAVTLLSQQALA